MILIRLLHTHLMRSPGSGGRAPKTRERHLVWRRHVSAERRRARARASRTMAVLGFIYDGMVVWQGMCHVCRFTCTCVRPPSACLHSDEHQRQHNFTPILASKLAATAASGGTPAPRGHFYSSTRLIASETPSV